jgi:hypothetical protein
MRTPPPTRRTHSPLSSSTRTAADPVPTNTPWPTSPTPQPATAGLHHPDLYPDLSAHLARAFSQGREAPSTPARESGNNESTPRPVQGRVLFSPPNVSASKLMQPPSSPSPSKHSKRTSSRASPSKSQLPRANPQLLSPPSLSKPMQPTLASLGFGQRYSRIISPTNLAGPKVGIDTYYVVIRGQEVGIFYGR